MPDNPENLVAAIAAQARAAQREVAKASSGDRAGALMAAARAIRGRSEAIVLANRADCQEARSAGADPAFLDRLMLDPQRVGAIAEAVETVASLPDPLGEIIERRRRPNGLDLARVRVPIGLIGIIYESRPNVTADAAALCLRSGNAVILRGGSEALRSNRALHSAFCDGIAAAGLPCAAVQLVPVRDRSAVGAMLGAAGLIDMIVPRGGKGLVERVQRDARVPVLAHLEGICHTYVHAAADPAMARAVAINAKLRRPGVCGAMETLLVDAGFPESRALLGALIAEGAHLRGDGRARALDPRIAAASAADWDTEYLSPTLSVAIVDGLDAACAHIACHGSGHTEAIVTADAAAAERFLAEVDSAIVMHNASSQFADGGEFGLGAEIGIATGRLHARGPVALEGLTTYKWVVRGSGQTRP